jgi:glycosyltransferase involved in cell wall biosynthesis
MNLIYSREAKEKLERLILEEKPEVAHLHIFQHQISLSILDVLKKYEIPVIYTAHDLQMLCPNYQMLTNGRVCEQCKGGHYTNCIKHRCIKDSMAKSALGTVEAYVNKLSKRYDIIDQIITPSGFYKKKFLEFGIAPDRVTHIPNFLDRACPAVNPAPDREAYYLYLGRLSHEKGIPTLIQAAKQTGITLKIVGNGPLFEELKKDETDHIRLLGFKSGQELTDLVGNAKAVILPSEWYENGPYSAIEALQLGRPLIGADIGGIPELIRDNGFLFESGNVQALAEAIGRLEALDTTAYAAACRASEELFQTCYTEQAHLQQLNDIYVKVKAGALVADASV